MAVETREYRAEARFQRVSPQKARLVLELIKGRGVQEALDTAAFTKKRIAPVMHKLLTSAVDNAKYVAGEQGIDLDVDNLYVKLAVANDGPRMKRIRPAPMGRAYPLSAPADAHHAVGGGARRRDVGLVTRVEEPEAAPASKKTGAKKAAAPAAKKSAPKKTAAKKAARRRAIVARASEEAGPSTPAQEARQLRSG